LVIGFTALLAIIAAIIVFALWRKKVLKKKNEGEMSERLNDSNVSTESVILDLCNFFIFYFFFFFVVVVVVCSIIIF
jgi:ABC-type Fe3+ transport system permease subunit